MSLLRRHVKPAILVLADGSVFRGESFGADGERFGEVVFNTGMTGYQEVLTDPSYRGQIVTMTYTQQGNYGVNTEDDESWRPWVEGFVVREASIEPSNFRARVSLSQYLVEHGIPGLSGVDTRRLTRHIRTTGAQMAIISTVDLDADSCLERLRQAPPFVDVDFVLDVTCPSPRRWAEEGYDEQQPSPPTSAPDKPTGVRPKPRTVYRGGLPLYAPRIFRVACLDYGIKQNILRHLYSRGCDLIVLPATATSEEVLEWQPDGVLLSNGPGNPELLHYAINATRGLVGKVPVFGVCLGQQIIGHALGGRTYKLKFGHRGVNHPVQNLLTGEVEITTQNHGFCVDMDSLAGSGMEATHINLNDMTAEGMRHTEYPLFSVQYHPEAGPGPHDSSYLFDQFIKMMSGEAG